MFLEDCHYFPLGLEHTGRYQRRNGPSLWETGAANLKVASGLACGLVPKALNRLSPAELVPPDDAVFP
jgi:hypothetical protein